MPLDLKKKLGPLTRGQWLGVGVGGGLAYILWKRHQNAAATGAASTALTGGTSIPLPGVLGGSGSAGTSSTGAPVFSSLSDWMQAAIATMTQQGINPADAYNGIQDWINGSCVSAAQYKGLSAVIGSSSVGLPPGFGSSLPNLSVCPSAPNNTGGGGTPTNASASTPSSGAPSAPNLPPALVAAMTNNGEHLVDTAYDATTNTFLYLTNQGGIYALNPQGGTNGAVFYGSYLGLPAAGRQGGPRTFQRLLVNSDGTYTAVDTAGETYTFTPGTPQGG